MKRLFSCFFSKPRKVQYTIHVFVYLYTVDLSQSAALNFQLPQRFLGGNKAFSTHFSADRVRKRELNLCLPGESIGPVDFTEAFIVTGHATEVTLINVELCIS